DCRGVVTVPTRDLQQRVLPQVIALEVVVDVAENRVVLDEGRWRARSPTEVPGIEHGIADVDRVAEVARVTEVMPGRDRGGIGGRERWKECMNCSRRTRPGSGCRAASAHP